MTSQVKVPSFRVDVTRPQDLMEEVARLSGYNQIPTTFPPLPARVRPAHDGPAKPGAGHSLRVRFFRAINYSFISADSCDRIQLDADDPRRPICRFAQSDFRRAGGDADHIGSRVCWKLPSAISPGSRTACACLKSARFFSPSRMRQLPWKRRCRRSMDRSTRKGRLAYPDAACDFYDIKGAVEGSGACPGHPQLSFTALPDEQCATPARATRPNFHDGQDAGIVGEVDAAVVERYSLKQPAFIFELDLEAIGQTDS
jgi:phenylalanyl-tRNA synthetase beta chain